MESPEHRYSPSVEVESEQLKCLQASAEGIVQDRTGATDLQMKSSISANQRQTLAEQMTTNEMEHQQFSGGE